jgi:hypothetical protein
MKRWKHLRNRLMPLLVLLSILAGLIFPLINPTPAHAVDVPRYFVMGQVFVVDGAHINSDLDGRWATAGNKTINLTDDGTHGTFDVYMASGASGTLTGASLTTNPTTLVAGVNNVGVSGSGAVVLALTLGTAANWTAHSSWSATSGGACSSTDPTSADSVYFDANSFTAASQILTVDATANCLNMDWTGALNTPTLAGTNVINIYGNYTGIAGMIYSGTNQFLFGASSGNFTITSGATVVAFKFGLNASSSTANYTLLDQFTGGTVSFFVKSGTLTTGNFNITCASFYDSASAAAKTLALGTSVITCTSVDFAAATPTVTGAHTINVSGTGTFYGGGATGWATVNLNGTSHVVSGSNTFVNLTRQNTVTAVKTDTLTLTSGTTQTVTGVCALIGNSVTNRLLVQSSTLGTAATIHATAWTGTLNTDFMDITSTDAIDLPATMAADSFGDCGGNTGITFTTSAAQTSASTDTWSTAAKWTSRVPLPQDDVTCSHNTTVDMPRIGRSITITGTPVISLSNGISNYGSFTLVSGMTYTTNSNYNYLRGRVAGLTFTSGGKNIIVINVSAPSGTYTLQDATSISGGFVQTVGTFNDGGQTITNSATGTKWSITGGTYVATGTIILTNTGALTYTFTGGSQTYNNVTVQGAGAYALTISGNNTFNTFTVDRSVAAKTLTLTAGSNQQVADFVCTTSGTRVLTINSTGAAATLTKTGGGTIGPIDYLTISNNTGAPANTWHYTKATATVGANVVGWEDGRPTVTTSAPTSVEETTATFNGNITDLNYGGNATEKGFDWDIDSGAPYANNQHVNGSYGISAITELITGLAKGELYYLRAYAINPIDTGYGTELTFLTKPDEPNTFVVSVASGTQISITWVKGTGALNTVIRAKLNSYPADITDGAEVYNNNGAAYNHTPLGNGEHWYYRAWSYATEGGLTQYSDLYAEGNATTWDENSATTVAATVVEETAATLNGTITATNGADATTTGFEYDIDSGAPYASDIHTVAGHGVGTFLENVAALTKGELYYFRAYATNPVGTGYGGELTFLTKPDEPTAFTAVVGGSGTITLSWTTGTGFDKTMVRYRTDGVYPATYSDGTEAYFDTASTYSHTGLTNGTTYMYRAWSYATEGGAVRYSDLYASASCMAIGSGTVPTVSPYSKSFTVTGSTCGAQTNYQVKMQVQYGAGSDIGGLNREPSLSTYAMDAGTGATTIVDTQLTSTVDDFYNGATFYNVTRSLSGTITDYVGATKTATCTSVAAQTNTDVWYIVGRTPTVYLDSKSQADFDDLRFTKSDGVTALDAWLRNKVDSSYAYIWVELDAVPASPTTTTFYLYYGDATAVSDWSGADTFVVFDDFERGADGDTVGGSWTESTAHVHISTTHNMGTVTGYSGSRSMMLVGGAAPPAVTIPVVAGVNNYAVDYTYYKEELAGFYTKRGNGTTLIDTYFNTTEDITVENGAGYQDTTMNCQKDAWDWAEYNDIDWTGQTMSIKVNELTSITGIDISNASATYSGVVGLTGFNNAGDDTWIDLFFVRKYCTSEPLITAWAAVVTPTNPLVIQDAKVVTGYKETDDWLIMIRYINTYPPYYDTYDVKKYFVFQLLDSTGAVKAQTSVPEWGNKVGSIYLAASSTSSLTYGGTYSVRMYGTFVPNPYVSYTLIGTDWLGSDLINLDSWVRTSATVIGTYYSTSLTSFVAERGEVLNSTGSAIFSSGIAGLSQVRPAIFQTYTVPSTYVPGTITQAGRLAIPAWQTNIGPDGTIMLTRLGNIVGIGGDIIAVIAFLIMMFVLMALAFPAGNTTAALVLSLPILGAAIWFGVDLLYIGMLALVAAFLFIKNFWIDKGN